jgi:hypothetical protein
VPAPDDLLDDDRHLIAPVLASGGVAYARASGEIGGGAHEFDRPTSFWNRESASSWLLGIIFVP